MIMSDLTIEYDPEYLASLVEGKPKPVKTLPVEDSNFVCFRHQIAPTTRFCALCDAKRQAKGNVETAKRIYVNRNLPNYGYYED